MTAVTPVRVHGGAGHVSAAGPYTCCGPARPRPHVGPRVVGPQLGLRRALYHQPARLADNVKAGGVLVY